ncbi:MAG TPA: carboxypeptidase-like regulatory domain-containing protein [Planctomycetota bacterium]|nr:carboxypeptidase regulatory-like domain-containing protein [Planctomycetota bacterium]HRV79908.1 carboxypeptidase-like regulatory domain-containing protein [Planctomycetota bacterium]
MSRKSASLWVLVVSIVGLAIFLRTQTGPSASALESAGKLEHVGVDGNPAEELVPPMHPHEARVLEAQPSAGERKSVASVVGKVSDPTGQAVSGLVVQMEMWQTPNRCAVTDALGIYRFEEVPTEEPLALTILQDSVPSGLIAPRGYFHGEPGWKRNGMAWPQGYFTEVVHATATELLQVKEWQLLFEGRIVGRISRWSDSSPVVGVRVRFQPWLTKPGERQPWGDTIATDSNGDFSASLSSGQYKLCFELARSTIESDRVLPGIPCRNVTLHDGERLDLGELALGGGEHVLQGRVVDQHGSPVPDLVVIGYCGATPEEGEPPNDWSTATHRVKTDADGFYVMEGLGPGLLAIQAGPDDYDLKDQCTGKRLVKFPDLLIVSVEDPKTTAQPIEVLMSEPFRILLRVGPRPNQVAVRKAVIRALPGAGAVRGKLLKTLEFDARGGQAAWMCQTPHDAVLIEWFENGRSVQTEVVEPVPNSVHELVMN